MHEVIILNYADRIRSLREDHDQTQVQIAELLGMGQRSYCDYELGKTRIPVDSLILMAKLCNVSMDFICGLTQKKGAFPINRPPQENEPSSKLPLSLQAPQGRGNPPVQRLLC